MPASSYRVLVIGQMEIQINRTAEETQWRPSNKIVVTASLESSQAVRRSLARIQNARCKVQAIIREEDLAVGPFQV